MTNITDTRVYRWLEVATDFFLLDLMWLVACLPVVTIFPSTAAMFGVVRDWVREKEGGLAHNFVSRFKENFGQSLLVGAVWTVFGVALFLDFLVANQLSFWSGSCSSRCSCSPPPCTLSVPSSCSP